jgi:ectoine hydroxylase-related dioxygenase (phytanoyl-CoA dioxygenase family)
MSTPSSALADAQLAHGLLHKLAHKALGGNRASAYSAHRSWSVSVGRRGLEPLTPCASCKCATNCANGPEGENPTTRVIWPWSGQYAGPQCRGSVTSLQLGSVIHDNDRTQQDRDTGTVRGAASPLPDLEHHLERIALDGYTVLPNAIEPHLIDEIDQALLELERDLGTVPATNLFEGLHTMRVYNLLVHGSTFEKIPIHPHVLPVVEGVLDPGLLISSLSSIAIGPDEQAQPIHADDQLIPIRRPHVSLICNTMWAITDFTEQNGATRVVPGSHLRDEAPNPLERYDSVPAEMEKGSVLVWVGSLWHGGGANRTNRRRVGIAMNYCAGYIRQQENQQLGVPPSLVKTFPRRLQELIGYSVYNGLVGHIDKKNPAQVVLDGNDGVDMVWDLLDARSGGG